MTRRVGRSANTCGVAREGEQSGEGARGPDCVVARGAGPHHTQTTTADGAPRPSAVSRSTRRLPAAPMMMVVVLRVVASIVRAGIITAVVVRRIVAPRIAS